MSGYREAEAWLRKAVRNAPLPMPPGFFPLLLEDGERAGFSRESLRDALDEWLGFGYCRVIDPVSEDIELLPRGEAVFGRAASLVRDFEPEPAACGAESGKRRKKSKLWLDR